MAVKPANPRLWKSLTLQARSRFHPYPSIAASSWVHKTYEKDGGQFIKTGKDKGKL